MHEAISRVWKNSIKTEEEISKTIQNIASQYIDHSLLASFEKESIKEDIVNEAPQVASSLIEHFNQKGTIKAEEWVETDITYKYNKEDVTIMLHGKLDAVIETNRELLVFDYKTRESMSEKDIRGETKSSDGNYFRQLIFYRILLEASNKNNHNILPSLVFIKPNQKGECPIISIPVEKSDIERVKGEINSLIESVWSNTILKSKCSNNNCNYCK
jgi:ATP-dependent exoDNAse (exonuclease V) beta subunit